MSLNVDISNVFGWFSKVTQCLKPFRPETRNMRINFKDSSSEIEVVIHITDSIRKNMHFIEIPQYENFQITKMMDSSFNTLRGTWFSDNNCWKTNPDDLTVGERYFIVMKGRIPESFLKKYIRIQPASNRDQTAELDRYWLNSMLNNVEDLEKIYQSLDIEEVNFGVNIAIDKVFAMKIPKDLSNALKITK